MEVEERSAAIGALSLTAREIEYISLAAIGFKNIEIADILSVTNSTVKKTLETVFSKLQLDKMKEFKDLFNDPSLSQLVGEGGITTTIEAPVVMIIPIAIYI